MISKITGRAVSSPRVSYKLAETRPDAEARLNKAFDLLFEETLKMEIENKMQDDPELPTKKMAGNSGSLTQVVEGAPVALAGRHKTNQRRLRATD